MKRYFLFACGFLLVMGMAPHTAQADFKTGFSAVSFMTAADSGISTANTYAYAVNLGPPAVSSPPFQSWTGTTTINGVPFEDGTTVGKNYFISASSSGYPHSAADDTSIGLDKMYSRWFSSGTGNGAGINAQLDNLTTPGVNYDLRLYTGDTGLSGPSPNNIFIGDDIPGEGLNSFSYDPYGKGSRQYVQYEFTATPQSNTMLMYILPSAFAGSDGFQLYGFTLQEYSEVSTPEPAMLGIVGLGLVGLFRRRRQQI